MGDYISRIESIKISYPDLKDENFVPAKSGTHHAVFISKNFVIRFRDDNPSLLQREAKLLETISDTLVPKVLWKNFEEKVGVIVENRLHGENISLVWKSLSVQERSKLVSGLVEFIGKLRNIVGNRVSSVSNGKEYSNFIDLLLDGVQEKISKISEFDKARAVIAEIEQTISGQDMIGDLFNGSKISLIHGDLINHNLLSDGGKLTGVLDWELACYGDQDFDLFRLFYYRECAMAYHGQGVDDTYESEYMDILIEEIYKSGLIGDDNIFQKKYAFVRAIFFVNALYWDVSSNKAEENLASTINLWFKGK
ncbi:MAG: aminoglycoside phosphotransferase family protein [Candidatus Taylorbacteria bacterium]